jgi:hypothetical protein
MAPSRQGERGSSQRPVRPRHCFTVLRPRWTALWALQSMRSNPFGRSPRARARRRRWHRIWSEGSEMPREHRWERIAPGSTSCHRGVFGSVRGRPGPARVAHRCALTIGSIGASPTCPGPMSSSLQRLDPLGCSGLGSTGGQVEVLLPFFDVPPKLMPRWGADKHRSGRPAM